MLSAGNGCIFADCGQSNCPASEEQPFENRNADNCDDCCSPFFACSNCLTFSLPVLSFSLTIPAIDILSRETIHHSFLYTEFYHSIWQPPKTS